MKNYLEARFNLQKLTQQELRAAIFEAWDAIDPEYLQRLAHGMVYRLKLVLKEKGDCIGY